MNRIGSLLRWLLHGESNVTASLTSLSNDVRDLQHRLDTAERERGELNTTLASIDPAPDPWLVAVHSARPTVSTSWAISSTN